MPQWLATRMTTMGTAISESVLHHYGSSALLSRLSDPFWFQALGSVMGMDWHSSGITTSVLGALKRGLNPRSHELGIYICGGRGKHSRNTPGELRSIADKTGLDGEALVRTSRLAAKVDNNAIADGFQIYLHGFILSKSGEWAIVQQGMNEGTRLARRYHWHSETVKDFTCEPHTGIVGANHGVIQNLVDERAKPAQGALLAIANDNPQRTLTEVMKMRMPIHHDVRAKDVDLTRLGAVLAVSHDRELHDFASLLLLENVGPRTLQTLAMVAEVIHGTPTRFSDPARFSFALGGKDRHPFPVPLDHLRRNHRRAAPQSRRRQSGRYRENRRHEAPRLRSSGRSSSATRRTRISTASWPTNMPFRSRSMAAAYSMTLLPLAPAAAAPRHS